jgi:hypothetical protein
MGRRALRRLRNSSPYSVTPPFSSLDPACPTRHRYRRGRQGDLSMRGGVFLSILALLMAMATLSWAPPARAANIFEKEFWLSGPLYSAKVPLCEEHEPLKMIQRRFGTKEGKFWNSDLKIVGFEQIEEVSWQPWAPGTIPRRFCRASALVSDGVRRPMYYSITEDGGMIGIGIGVEFCVVGLDKEWSYQPACLRAKP